MDIFPAHSPILENQDEKEVYACTQCSSNIEILSIDDKDAKITFTCLNNDETHNHGTQTMSINEYIKNMENNTYLYDECAICHVTQDSLHNGPIFKYCTNCNIVICNQCENEHVNNMNINHHLIYNNERRIKCLIHPQHNNDVYCFSCKRHLCKECLKTKEHFYHKKNNIYESYPSDIDIINFNKILELLRINKQKLEKKQKTKGVNVLEQIKFEENFKMDIISIEDNLKKELDINENKKNKELIELERKFEICKFQIINNYNNNSVKIKDKYKQQKENKYNSFNEKINKINNINNLILINEIIKRTQEKYKDNFFNNINMINILTSFQKSENNEIRKIFFNNGNTYINQNQKNSDEIEEKDEFEIKTQSKYPSPITKKEFISKKVKRENDSIQDIEKIKYENKNININWKNDYILNNQKDNNISFERDNNKKQIINDIEENISKSKDEYNVKKEESEKQVNFDEINEKENDIFIFLENNNEKEKDKDKEKLDIISNNITHSNIIDNAYCSTEIDNSFTVFNSVYKNCYYLIYATEKKSIINNNLSLRKIVKTIPTAHSSFISNIQYYYDKYNNLEVIMSLSYNDCNLKLWNFSNWKCFRNIKNIYSEGYLYSACIFTKKKISYFAVSNYSAPNSVCSNGIKVYNFNGKINKNINNSNINTLLIKPFKLNNEIFIVACGEGNIRAYNYNNNTLYKKYEDNNMNIRIFSFIIYKKKETVKIFGSYDDQHIRIWNFLTSELLNKIKIECTKLRGICIYNENYLLVGCGDNSIKVMDLEKGIIIKSLKGHTDKVCTIKEIILPDLGICFFSHAYDDHILLWNIKNEKNI